MQRWRRLVRLGFVRWRCLKWKNAQVLRIESVVQTEHQSE